MDGLETPKSSNYRFHISKIVLLRLFLPLHLRQFPPSSRAASWEHQQVPVDWSSAVRSAARTEKAGNKMKSVVPSLEQRQARVYTRVCMPLCSCEVHSSSDCAAGDVSDCAADAREMNIENSSRHSTASRRKTHTFTRIAMADGRTGS